MSKKLWQLGANDQVAQPSDLTGKASLTDLPYGYNALSQTLVEATDTYTIGNAYEVGDYIKRTVDGVTTRYVCNTALSASDNTSWSDAEDYFDVNTKYTATAVDGSINILDACASGDLLTITLPYPTSGKVTDLIVRLDCSSIASGGTVPVITWACNNASAAAQTITWRDIIGDEIAETGVYWIMVTLYPTGLASANTMDGTMSIRELAGRS